MITPVSLSLGEKLGLIMTLQSLDNMGFSGLWHQRHFLHVTPALQ